MRIGDVFFLSFEGMRERKFRFALNLLGILIGCAAITGLIALTQGMNMEISSQLGSLGTQTITVTPRYSFGVGGATSRGTAVLDWRTVDIIGKISGVKEVAPVSSGGAVSYQVRGSTYFASVMGVSESFFKVNEALEVASGRTLIRSDSASAVIGSRVANPRGSDSPVLKIGDRIKVTANVRGVQKELTLRVVGVLKEAGAGFQSTDSVVIIPGKTYEQFFETGGVYSSIQVLAESSEQVEAVAGAIRDKVRGVSTLTAAAVMEMMGNVVGTIEAVLGGVAAISLMVAGVGIINTMTVSVMERTREIGTMKAVGAKSSDILAMFVTEAALTGVVGGFLGASFGFLLARLVGNYVGIQSSVTLSLGVFVVGFAMVVSVVSGFYPAWRASSLHPVEALRSE